MKEFKLNSLPKVVDPNYDIIFPEIGAKAAPEFIRSVMFTEATLDKLSRMRAKYRLSRSALIRILIENAPL